MKEYRNLMIVASFVSLIIGIFFGFLLGLGSCLRQSREPNHSIYAKAIELKSSEADSLKIELEQCKGVYRELNNGQKYIKP